MAKVKISDLVVYKTTKSERTKLKIESKKLAAIVVGISEEKVNLKIFLDKDAPDLYKKNVKQGHDEGYWNIII